MTTLMKSAKIMIVEDHPIVRRGYAQLVSQQEGLEICGETDSISEAIQLLDDCRADLWIIDISLKDGNGLELVKSIRSRPGRAKVLVVSAHEESLYAERVLRAGANGYVNKQDAIDHLIVAIRDVLAGEIYLSAPMVQKVLTRANHPRRATALSQSPVDQLTDRELEVVQLLGEGASSKQIAGKLHLSPKTVDRHRENIKRKLNLSHSTDLVRFATTWVLESR